MALRHIVEHVYARIRHLVDGVHRTVVASHASHVGKGIACRCDVEVADDHVVDGLGVDALQSPVDAQELSVDGEVATPLLRELEVLVEDVDGLGRLSGSTSTGCRKIGVDLIRIQDEVDVAGVVSAVRQLLNTRVGEVVAEPHVGHTTGEDTGTTANDELVILQHIPAEAKARRPHRRRRNLMVGLQVPALRSGILIELSVLCRRVEHQRHVDAHTISDVEVRLDVPLVLEIEAQLTGAELSSPAACASDRLYALTITEAVDFSTIIGAPTCDVAAGVSHDTVEEVISIAEVIGTIEVLAEEVGKVIELVVSTEGNVVVAQRPREVVGNGIDILVKTVGHRGTLVTDIQSTIADIADLNHREGGTRVTLVVH